MLEALGLQEDSKSLAAPGVRENEARGSQFGVEQEADRTGGAWPRVGRGIDEDYKFRAIAARLNYMAADMPDVQYACKEACREMSRPTEASWEKVKKIGRYLVRRKRAVWRYPWAQTTGKWRVFTDSDWAGDPKERKSTSGGILMLGDHCIKTWSHTQDALAMSSCEAEFYAMAEGALEAAMGSLGPVVEGATWALGAQAEARELGVMVADVVVELSTDSSSAKSFASRRGLGRNRHVEVKWLWLQAAVSQGKIKLRKIPGSQNPADVCTKYLSLCEMKDKLVNVNIGLEALEGVAGARDRVAAVQEVSRRNQFQCRHRCRREAKTGAGTGSAGCCQLQCGDTGDEAGCSARCDQVQCHDTEGEDVWAALIQGGLRCRWGDG